MQYLPVKSLLTAIGCALTLGGCVSTQGEPRSPERTAAVRAVTPEELRRILENERSRKRRTPRPPQRRQRARAAKLVIPVVGVEAHELRDSFGDPRSGGRRHQGIDIMAPRWTHAVAAVNGTVSSINTGRRSGKAIWIRGDDRRSYFYAHLEAWAPGLREGKRVHAGELVGYVGNSGNASMTPTHLHFEIRENRRNLNPYTTLVSAVSLDAAVPRAGPASSHELASRLSHCQLPVASCQLPVGRMWEGSKWEGSAWIFVKDQPGTYPGNWQLATGNWQLATDTLAARSLSAALVTAISGKPVRLRHGPRHCNRRRLAPRAIAPTAALPREGRARRVTRKSGDRPIHEIHVRMMGHPDPFSRGVRESL